MDGTAIIAPAARLVKRRRQPNIPSISCRLKFSR